MSWPKAPAWSRVPLGTVAKIINGFPFKSEFFAEKAGVPVIRIRDVTAGQATTFYRGPIPEGYWVEPGDIVIGMDGDFNLRVWSSAKALMNQRVCKVVVDTNKADKNFVAYALPGYLRAVTKQLIR
jgi:type I restriction enzyme, S subunit